jgi:hypothetical protein
MLNDDTLTAVQLRNMIDVAVMSQHQLRLVKQTLADVSTYTKYDYHIGPQLDPVKKLEDDLSDVSIRRFKSLVGGKRPYYTSLADLKKRVPETVSGVFTNRTHRDLGRQNQSESEGTEDKLQVTLSYIEKVLNQEWKNLWKLGDKIISFESLLEAVAKEEVSSVGGAISIAISATTDGDGASSFSGSPFEPTPTGLVVHEVERVEDTVRAYFRDLTLEVCTDYDTSQMGPSGCPPSVSSLAIFDSHGTVG